MNSRYCENFVKELQARLPYQSNEYLRSPRYIRSCLEDHNYDIRKTEAAILKTYRWREEIGIDSILSENFDDIFVPFDIDFGGVDRGGRPILSIQAKDMGKLATASMHRAVKDSMKDQNRSIRWAFYMGETVLQAIADSNAKSPDNSVDSIVVIVDMKGINVMELLQYAPTLLPIALPLLTTCREHYSGIMYKMFVINGSKKPARLGLQLLRGQQNSDLVNRVKILGKKKHKWQKVLLENIALDQLSTRFGGTREPQALKTDVFRTRPSPSIQVEEELD